MVTDLQPKDLPHRLCLWTLSSDGTTLIAIDCLSDDDAPRFYRFRLPDHLHGRYLYSSVGHFLHLEEMDFDLLEEEEIHSLTGIRLFDPFNWTEFACLPSSASLMPGIGIDVIIHTVVLDIKRSIALALVDNYEFRLVYTSLDVARRGVDPVTGKHCGTWTDLTHLLSGHSISGCDIFLQSAILHQDGLFYAVDDTGNKVFALDFSSRPPALADVTFDLPNNYNTSLVADHCCYQSASLISSGSSLFLVRWRNTLRQDGTDGPREIDVFRLNEGLKGWVPVNSLGRHSFFIGNHSSFSMSVVDFPELKSNRVYICLDARIRISGNQLACYYDGDADIHPFRFHLLYYLEDESWDVFFDKSRIPEDFPSMSSASVWMLPPTGASTLG